MGSAARHHQGEGNHRNRRSIRWLLVTLIVALVAPLLGLAAYFGTQRYQSERDRAEDRLLGLADATAVGVHQFLQDTKRLMDGVAQDPQLAAMDPDACGPFFTPAAEFLLAPTYANMATWRSDGTPICSMRPTTGSDGMSSPPPGLAEALAADDFTLTPVQQGFRSQRWITAITRPLHDASGRRVGILSLSIDLIRFQEILVSLNPPEESIVSITDLGGTVVARSKDPELWVGKNPPAPDAESPDDPTFQERGFSRASTFDGVLFGWGFVRIPETDWVVYVGFPYADAFRDTFHGALQFLALGLLVLMGAFILGRSFYLRITTPLQALVEGVAQVGLDEPARLPTDGPKEIAWVAERFNQVWAARAHAERERERSDERMRSLVENAVTGIYVVTEGGRFIQANQAMVKLLGYDSEEDLLATPATALHASPEERRRQIERYGHAAAFQGVPVEWRRRDGKPVNVRLSGRRMVLDTGEVGWEIIAEDVTELTRLQSQALQAQKMEALGRLAGGIAHDFNNLLTVVQGQAELLQEDPDLGPDQQEQAAEIYLATLRGAALNRQLLAFGRRSPGERTAVDLNEVVAGFELVLRRAVGEEVRMEISLEPSIPAIRADRSQVEQILMNLVVNARDAMPGSGLLVIATHLEHVATATAAEYAGARGGNHVVLRITDTGTGIPDEVLPHIFEPFYSTKPDTKGTGLGLATVYGIVTDSGGHIRVRSTPGKGTEFAVYFPAHEGPEVRQTKDVSTSRRHEGSGVVLLVEDEAGVRKLARTLLERAGYQVLEAQDGVRALEIVEGFAGTIDVLLSDIVMPGMRGHQLAETLATRGRIRRAVFFSGYPEGFEEEGLGALERWEFISKPFTGVDLLGALGRVLGRPTPDSPPAREP